MELRVIGIDPGSRRTGYGLISVNARQHISHLDNGMIAPQTAWALPQRIDYIATHLRQIIHTFKPHVMAIESLFYATNVASVLKLAHVRGAAMLMGTQAGLVVCEYSALQIKQAVTGSGRASKNQVQQMMKIILSLPEVAQEDASDALACAVCHAQHVGAPVNTAWSAFTAQPAKKGKAHQREAWAALIKKRGG